MNMSLLSLHMIQPSKHVVYVNKQMKLPGEPVVVVDTHMILPGEHVVNVNKEMKRVVNMSFLLTHA